MEIGSIVRVTITRGSKSVTRAGFGTPIILSSEAAFTPDIVREYTNITGVAADFATSTATYKMASKLFGQELKPKKIKIGKRTAMIAQVTTLTPVTTSQTIQSFKPTIAGVAYDFVSDATPTASEVVTGLIALINADTNCPAVASGTTTLVLTGKVPGSGFSVLTTANLTQAATTANNGIVEDLFKIIDADNDFYCIHSIDKSVGEIMSLAETVETLRKIFIFSLGDAAILQAGSTDIASKLKAKGYQRTAIVWSGDFASAPEAAWAGGVLPMKAGSETWKFKAGVGITPDKLTATQESQAKLKNVNIFTTVAGINMFSEGYMCGGEFIDVIRFIDSLQADIEESVFARLASMAKVPFTDPGVAVIELEISNALQRGVQAGGLKADPAPYTDVPKVADVSVADKGSRTLPDMKFGGELAGAVHFTEIAGVLSV